MPMNDVYVLVGTFTDKHEPAGGLARTLLMAEELDDIPMFPKNTAPNVRTWVLLSENPRGLGTCRIRD